MTTTAPEVATSVLVQSDGAIVLSGSYPNGADDRWLLRVVGDEPVVTSTTTTTLPETLCGDADGSGTVTSSDALRVLRKAVGQDVPCPQTACDVDASGAIQSSDALRVLRKAVGQNVTLTCPA